MVFMNTKENVIVRSHLSEIDENITNNTVVVTEVIKKRKMYELK